MENLSAKVGGSAEATEPPVTSYFTEHPVQTLTQLGLQLHLIIQPLAQYLSHFQQYYFRWPFFSLTVATGNTARAHMSSFPDSWVWSLGTRLCLFGVHSSKHTIHDGQSMLRVLKDPTTQTQLIKVNLMLIHRKRCKTTSTNRK